MKKLSNIHLVTGYAGEPHVSANDQGMLNSLIFGDYDFVFPIGNTFTFNTIQKSALQTLIEIKDGEMMMQGRHVRIPPGKTEEILIPLPEQGVKRQDLIVMRYTKDATSGIESCSLVRLEGTESASTYYNPPQHTIGDLSDPNCACHDFPLYRMKISGNTYEMYRQFSPKNPLSGIETLSIQKGTATISHSTSRDTSVNVVFTSPFTKKPMVLVSQVFNESNIVVKQEDITINGFTAKLSPVSSNGSRQFSWIAIA